MTDVVSRGGSPQQALSLGVLSGAIETATEKLPLDNLVDIFTKTDVTKGFLRNVFSSGLKQMPAEAGEEFISQMAGYITDLGVMGWDESQIGEMWRNNVSSGLSESDAAAQTFLDILGGATYAGLGGAFSGFVMGGSTSTLAQTINYFGNRNTGKKIVKNNMAEPLLKYASGVTVSDENMQKQLTSILEQQKQSNADIGKVFNILSANATKNLQAEVNSLNGVSQNTDLTKAVTKSLLGAPLSSSEQSLVNSDSGITLLYKASRSQAYADAQTVFGFLKEFEQQSTTTQEGDVSSTPTSATGDTSDSGDASASVSGTAIRVTGLPTTRLQSNASGDTITTERGEYYEDKNTDILAKRGVSPADRSRNGVRSQNRNTEQMERILGVSAQSNETRGSIAAGLCGWVQTNNRQARQGLFRFLQSNVGNLSAQRINETDTVGRILNPELRDMLADSVFKTEDGTILSLYHWTSSDFDTFIHGDIGFHFGTLEAADKRRQGKTTNGEIGCFKEVYLAVASPVFINYDPITWCVFAASYKLKEIGIFTKEDISELERLEGFNRSQYDSEASICFREILEAKGYDGIVYVNDREGDLSVIALRAEQIVTVAENGVTKARLDNFDISNVQTDVNDNFLSSENESLIEDPTTGPEPDGAEITVAYMNGRVAPTGIQKAIESIADKLGVKLEFAEFYNADGSKAEHVNGYETDDGRVVVNVFSKRQVSFIFKHELTHTLKHSKGYELFKQMVLSSTAFKEWATKKAGVSSGAEATAILAQRAVESRTGLTIKGVDNATVNESDIDGRDEVLGDFIAENCFGMDDESAIKALRALADANRNIFVRLADKVRMLLDKIRGTQYDMSLRQIERRFRRVLNEKQNTLTNNETSGVQLSTNRKKRPKGLASSRKSVYDEYASNVEQWAYSSTTQTGDRKIFINSKTRKYVLLEATEANGGFIELTTGTFDKVKEFLDEYTNTQTEEFDRYIQIARTRQNNNSWDNDDANHIEYERANGEIFNRDSAERTTDRTRNTSEIGRYSEADSIDEPAFSTPKSNGKINLSVDSTVESDLSADEIREQLKNGEITVDEAMDAMQNLYGAIPKGELASRDIDVPMQTSDGKYTRRFARTVLESDHLTDEQVSDVSEELINEVLSYVPVGNEQAVKAADAAIENGTAEEQWKKVVYGDSDWASKEKIVIGERLACIRCCKP